MKRSTLLLVVIAVVGILTVASLVLVASDYNLTFLQEEYTASVSNLSPSDGETYVGHNPTFSFDVTTDCPHAKVRITFTNNRGFIDQVGWQGEEINGTGTYTRHIEYTPSGWGIDFPGEMYQWVIYIDDLTKPAAPDIYDSGWMTYYTGEKISNSPPVADADGEIHGTVGEKLYFDGSGCSDPDGINDIDYFGWQKDMDEATSSLYDDLKKQSGYVTYGEPGEYQVGLKVIDDNGFYSYDYTTAYISPQPDNEAPTAVCSHEGTINKLVGEDIYLNASASFDPDGEITKYEWDVDMDGDPEMTGVRQTVSYDHRMGYTVELTVTDDDDATDTDSFMVNVGTEYRQLTTSVEGGGSLSFDPYNASGLYPYNSFVVITANPNPGWVFDRWTGDIGTNTFVSTAASNPLSLKMDRDRDITAYFVENTTDTYTLTLTTSPSEGGTIQKSTNGPYTPGETVTLTATTESGYMFDHWSGDASGTSASVDVYMDSDKDITAHFVKGPPKWGVSPLWIAGGIVALLAASLIIFVWRKKHG